MLLCEMDLSVIQCIQMNGTTGASVQINMCTRFKQHPASNENAIIYHFSQTCCELAKRKKPGQIKKTKQRSDFDEVNREKANESHLCRFFWLCLAWLSLASLPISMDLLPSSVRINSTFSPFDASGKNWTMHIYCYNTSFFFTFHTKLRFKNEDEERWRESGKDTEQEHESVAITRNILLIQMEHEFSHFIRTHWTVHISHSSEFEHSSHSVSRVEWHKSHIDKSKYFLF